MITIYVLKCANDKYYVGKSTNLTIRLEDHFDGSGSTWTTIYKPISVIATYPNSDSYDEDKYTIMYMEKFGIANVRGGTFSRVTLESMEMTIISKMIKGANNKCFNCGSNSHFVKDCTKTTTKLCGRCGRSNHDISGCYAKTHLNGSTIESFMNVGKTSVESNSYWNYPTVNDIASVANTGLNYVMSIKKYFLR
jgi:hypothetical protein